MRIDAAGMDYRELNEQIRNAGEREIQIDNCLGQRYIGDGSGGRSITINGVPGNALGAYMDGSEIFLHGNAQDATGDTMNDGAIYIDGRAGDATGYAMRGGKIMVHGDIGYRAGIHMKAYGEKVPVLVVGGSAGSFLGEYQAGGTIVVLGLHSEEECPVGYFCGTGMHGGSIYLRSKTTPPGLPEQVLAKKADEEELAEILPLLQEFCEVFGEDLDTVLSESFYRLTPNTQNPYHRLYTPN